MGPTLTKKLGLYILNCAGSTARLLIDLIDLLIFSRCCFIEEASVDSQSLSLLLDITIFRQSQPYIFYILLASLIYFIQH